MLPLLKKLTMSTAFCCTFLFANCAKECCDPCDCNPCECSPCNTCNDTCNTCSCSPCCCEPCDFVPPCPPETCAYNAPFEIDIKCGWDFFVTGSFVYFQAKEENLEFINAATYSFPFNGIPSGFVTTQISPEYGEICFDYEPGFKVGIGFNFGCDDWAFDAEYFRYHANVGKGSFSLEANEEDRDTATGCIPALDTTFLFTPKMLDIGLAIPPSIPYSSYLRPANILGLSQTASDPLPTVSATGKWRLCMDLADFSLSRKYYIGRCLVFQTSYGLRAGWIDQEYNAYYNIINADAINATGAIEEFTYNVKAQTKSWGVGPRAGLNTNWNFCGGFFLFGDAAISILYTKYCKVSLCSDLEYTSTNPTTGQILVTYDSKFKTPDREFCYLRPQANLGLGLGWADYFCCNDWYFDLRVGYETHVFWNQNMFNKTFDLGVDPTATGGDLYLHGLVITARLDF